MNLFAEAITRFEELISGSGCEYNAVTLKRDYTICVCQYVFGVPLVAEFGGKTADIVTDYPIQAKTRVSFMFGATPDNPQKRTASCAIINAVSDFLCLARPTHACGEESHRPCFLSLKDTLQGSVYCCGHMPFLEHELTDRRVDSPEKADIILITGDGLFSDDGIKAVESCFGKKRMIFLGPETVGICTLLNLEHWCPYGR